MSIESEVFKKLKLNKEKLIPFGFKKEENRYTYSEKFMDGTFRADIYISENGEVTGKVYDLEIDDEYTNFRIEDAIGEFVNSVKEGYKNILQKIADNCFEKPSAKKDWLVPANPKYFDVFKAFEKNDTITWKQVANIAKGDIVYLYYGSPYSKIIFKCEVLENNIPYEYEDKNLSMQKVMKIKALRKYNDEFTFKKLQKCGVKSIRSQRSVPEKLKIELEKMEKKDV